MNAKDLIAVLEYAKAFSKEDKVSRTRTPKKDKEIDILDLVQQKRREMKAWSDFEKELEKINKKEEKKEEKKDELTVLQKTVYITLSALVGVPVYVYFLMLIGQRMADIVK